MKGTNMRAMRRAAIAGSGALLMLTGTVASAEALTVRPSRTCAGFGGKVILDGWADLNNRVIMRKNGGRLCVRVDHTGGGHATRTKHSWITISDGATCNRDDHYESFTRYGDYAVVLNVAHRFDTVKVGRFTKKFEPSTTAC